MMVVQEACFYLVDRFLQRSFKPQLYQIWNSLFCVQICAKNRRHVQHRDFINKLSPTFRDIHIKNICLVYRLRQLKLKDQFVPVDLFGITLLAVVSFLYNWLVYFVLSCPITVCHAFRRFVYRWKIRAYTSEQTFWYQSLLVCTKCIFRRQTKPLSSTEHRISVKRNICICKKYCLCPRCCVVASAKNMNCSWETTKEMPTKGTEICFVQFCRN